jgi:DNA-binding GntR family transcriptional regulator
MDWLLVAFYVPEYFRWTGLPDSRQLGLGEQGEPRQSSPLSATDARGAVPHAATCGTVADGLSSYARKAMAGQFAHRTVAASAADAIRRKIFDGQLKDGEPLRQDLLAAEFGISRTPVREALVQLEAEGLVKIEPHKGAVVAGASIANIEETFELRELLETKLLALSAPRLTPEDFAQIDEILKEYSAELRNQNVMRWGELNTSLHSRLYSRAARPQIQAIVDKLLLASDRYTRMQLLHTHGLERAEREHAEIVEHCRQGRIAEAEAALARHIHAVKEALIGLVAQPATLAPTGADST